ncbi:MAG: carbohydrate kinase family protein [Desulfocapsaceae bacterium]
MPKLINVKPVVAGIGEVLWDVMGDDETLGGAPVNFAYQAGQLGAEALAISSIGDDQRGERAVSTLAERGVATAHLTTIEGVETGYVQASVDAEGVASYVFPDDVAWDRIRIDPLTMVLASHLDAISFGSLAQRTVHSRSIIHRFLESLHPGALKVFDLNIRQSYYSVEIIRASLEQADVLKLNEEEIILLARLEDLKGSIDEQLRLLVERYRLSLAVLTRGGSGSLLVSNADISDHPGYQAEVVDTIGAGDSFTAVTTIGILKGYSLDSINEHANRVAAHVCSSRGAMVPLPEKLRNF